MEEGGELHLSHPLAASFDDQAAAFEKQAPAALKIAPKGLFTIPLAPGAPSLALSPAFFRRWSP